MRKGVNMKKKIFNVVLLAIVIILEVLHWGFTMVFASGPGVYHLQQVAYFSMLAWGYGMFIPGLCAFITCVTLILTLISLFARNGKLETSVIVFSSISFVISMFPLIRNVEYITIISIIIAVLLLINLVITVIPNKQNKKG